MLKIIASEIILTLLLIDMLMLAFNIQPAKSEPITIIVPDDYPTIHEAVNAASPGDIIHVYGPYYYRENVIVDKSVSLIGISRPGLVSFNVVANNVYIHGFSFCTPWGFPYGRAVVLNGVSGCKISNVTLGVDESSGIVLTDASNNVIANSEVGGLIWGGGIVFERSSRNTIFGNTIEAYYGPSIYLDDSSDNKFFHNQFYVYEARQVEVIGRSKNVWDDGYPSGGNYWSDHNPPDEDKDKIGDVPYVIDENNTDRYPLIYPYEFYQPGYVPKPDINKDGIVNIIDIAIVARAFGCKPGDANWKPVADMDINGIINILDISMVARDYGKTT